MRLKIIDEHFSFISVNLAKLLYNYFKEMEASHKILSIEGFKEESFYKKEGKIKAPVVDIDDFLCNKVLLLVYIYIYIPYTHTHIRQNQ